MEKFVLYCLLVLSIILIGCSIVVTVAFINSGDTVYAFIIPAALLSLGVWIFRGFLSARKYLKKVSNVLKGVDLSILKMTPSHLIPGYDRKIMEKEHSEHLQTAMLLLLKTEDRLTANQEKMWVAVQCDVPYNDPLKIQLKKKHFTCDFEDLCLN